jgi:periplasmic protein TonB
MGFSISSGRPEDRLATAVFVAALLHGLVIMGIRFNAAPPDRRPLPTLEVLLVPDGPAEEDNESAAYLSSRDQRGAGTGRDRQRTSLPEASASLLEHTGDVQGTEAAPAASDSSQSRSPVLAANSPGSRRAVTGEELEPTGRAALPVESRPLPQVGVNASAAEESLHLRGDASPDDRLLADTRGSQIAAYIDAWKRRVEQVGTLHFPEEARSRSLSRNPVLEVAIRSDGSLQQVVIRRTSGQREIDNAAINTVRLAAPFDPFPPAMRERYPVFRLSYEWQFMSGRQGAGTVRTGAP